MQKSKRDILPDILRGFAILAVVWGHCIQEGNGASYSSDMLYFDNKLYQFIYSFHMPLFALIAGYFACSSLKKVTDNKSALRLLVHRISTYLIPIVFWTLTEYVRETYVMTTLGLSDKTVPELIIGFFVRVLGNHWFLWAMIFCFVIVWVMHIYLHDNIYVYICMFIAFFFIPDGMNMHTYKYLLPYYLIAYYYHEYLMNGKQTSDSEGKMAGLLSRCIEIHNEKPVLLMIITGLIYLGLFLLYDRRAFIYVSGYRITKNIWYMQLIIDAYRFIIGLVGGVFFILLWRLITRKVKNYTFPVLRAFGMYSLGVYIFSGYITILIMRRFTDPLPVNDLRTFGETVIVAAVSLLLTYIFSLIPVLKRLVGR